jgi:DNA-binding CsgD family transcriptional regulator
MERLFVDAVDAIYAAAPDPTCWPRALQAIADVFGDIGAVMLWSRDDGGFGAIASPSLAEAQRDYQENGWYLRDTRSIRAIQRSLCLRSDAVTERHFISEEEASDPFFNDFLGRYSLRWCAAIRIAPDPHVDVGLAVQRENNKPPYSDAELESAARLGRHAEKSLRLSIRLLDAELANVGLGEALARLGIGVFALDSLKRVVFANPVGEGMLGDGLAVGNDRLLYCTAHERNSFDAAIEQMIRGEPADIVRDPKPILIHRRKSERPLTVYVLPVGSTTTLAAQFLTHTRAIVLAVDPGSSGPADPAVVRDVLGITLGEARVAALIGAGLPPREAARRLGITEETARTALKRVFSKSGVSRQSELAVLLTKLVLR